MDPAPELADGPPDAKEELVWLVLAGADVARERVGAAGASSAAALVAKAERLALVDAVEEVDGTLGLAGKLADEELPVFSRGADAVSCAARLGELLEDAAAPGDFGESLCEMGEIGLECVSAGLWVRAPDQMTAAAEPAPIRNTAGNLREEGIFMVLSGKETGAG